MNANIVKELERRQKILIENSKPNDVSTGMSGSLIEFTAALAPIGYPFEPEPWMDAEYTKRIMTSEEFDSLEYDEVFNRLFKEAYNKVNGK